jgi:hypothetical protein
MPVARQFYAGIDVRLSQDGNGALQNNVTGKHLVVALYIYIYEIFWSLFRKLLFFSAKTLPLPPDFLTLKCL